MDDVFDPQTASPTDRFLSDVLAGLAARQKTLPCQYFYDEVGSNLFEQITELPEYYPTRTEIGILNTHANAIAAALGAQTLLVEYGAGASTKTRILLDALQDPAGYVPIDVSEDFLLQTAAALKAEYPDLTVRPIAADFMVELGLPDDIAGIPVGFFPGSTIGNLSDDEIDQFLRAARRLLGADSKFIIGLDLRKSPDILIPAYDDAQGVTAAFNMNLLKRINRELGANFDLGAFQHEAIWNDDASRIEMHLRSQTAQTVQIGEIEIAFAAGETIHTENSRKFDLTKFVTLASTTGWTLRKDWQDGRGFFAVLMLEATA
ncbi:MAG: L-histidine N(alpha)-methyltransferase [Henriciella sp.]